MANTLTAVIPKLLAQGLMALREMAIMPRLVNRRYEILAGQKGSTIDVPIPSVLAVRNVAPAEIPPEPADSTPTTVPIALDQWKEVAFHLTDKERLEVMEDEVLPMQASEAIRALANNVDQYLLALYTYFYGFHGTSGVTPFGTPGVKDATGIRKVLNKQLAPPDNRFVVLDPDAEGAALALREFADANFSGSVSAILEGNLNRKLGFQWFMDQNIPQHVAGTLSDGSGKTAKVDNTGGYAVGTKTIAIDNTTLTGTVKVGDIFRFAGHDQTYVATAAKTAAANAIADLAFEPGLQAAVDEDEVLTFEGNHTVNLAFHRDAIALASRPLSAETDGSIAIRSAVDPVSGLALRVELTRQHRQWQYAYDILYGASVVRRELGTRLAG